MRAALVLVFLPLLACKGDPPAPPIASSTPPVLSVASVAPSSPPTATASTAPAPTAVYPTEVELPKLLAEYKDNEVRADGQFKGKLIRTFGTVLAVVGAAGAEMKELMIMYTERYTGPALRGIKDSPGTRLAVAMNILERDGKVVGLHNMKTYESRYWLAEHAPKDPDVIAIATGDKDMPAVDSWRAQGQEFEAVFAELTGMMRKPDDEIRTHKLSLPALLLYGLGLELEDDPISALLETIEFDLETLSAAQADSPLSFGLRRLAHRVHVVAALADRANAFRSAEGSRSGRVG